jgi:hypothetical protein
MNALRSIRVRCAPYRLQLPRVRFGLGSAASQVARDATIYSKEHIRFLLNEPTAVWITESGAAPARMHLIPPSPPAYSALVFSTLRYFRGNWTGSRLDVDGGT